MKRIVPTIVFAAVALGSASAQAASLGTTNTFAAEPPATTSYQIVVQARLVGAFRDVSGLERER